MADDETTTGEEPTTTQPPTEGGTGTAVTDEGGETADEREDHAEGGAGQQGRGRVQ